MPGKSSTTEIRELDRVTSKLRIGDSAQTDAGRYSCEAENAYGKSHFSIDVTIWGEGEKMLHCQFATQRLADQTETIQDPIAHGPTCTLFGKMNSALIHFIQDEAQTYSSNNGSGKEVVVAGGK